MRNFSINLVDLIFSLSRTLDGNSITMLRTVIYSSRMVDFEAKDTHTLYLIILIYLK